MKKDKFVIKQVKLFDQKIAKSIRSLVAQLGDNHPLSDMQIKKMLNSSCNFLYVAEDESTGNVAGMATLIVYRIPYVKKALVEDVVVDKNYRGKGIGTRLMSALISKAKEEDVAYIDLTSRPSRKAGNKLYINLGFVKRSTNVYRLKID